MNKTSSAKKILSWLCVLWTIVGLAFVLILVDAVGNWSKSLMPIRTITVSGKGEAVLVPDIASISFSVISEGKDVVALQKSNTDTMNQAIAFVKEMSVDQKDIQTTGYNLSPKYEYDEKKRRSYIDGYTLTQSVSVKVRDLNKTGEVIAGLPGFGINQITGPNFTVDDPEKYLTEARAEAFHDAVTKARELASLNGVRVGRVVTFFENSGGGYPPVPYFAEKGMAMGMGGDAQVRPALEPGSDEVQVHVSVTYELK